MNTSGSNRARASAVAFSADTMTIVLVDGRTLGVPLEWFPSLRDATAEARVAYRLVGRGIGIHWESLDEDLSVDALLSSAEPPCVEPSSGGQSGAGAEAAAVRS